MSKITALWSDGSRLKGRIKDAYLAGLLTRKVRIKDKEWWYAKCSTAGCSGDYNFTRKGRPAFTQKKCLACLGQIRVDGVLCGLKSDAACKTVALWKKEKASNFLKNVPYFWCEHEGGCKKLVRGKSIAGPSFCRHHNPNNRMRPYEATYNLFLASQRTRNRTRSSPIKMSLSYMQFVRICTEQPCCFYCGIDVGRVPYTGRGKSGFFYTRAAYLDRLRVNRGYTPANVVTCCGICNMTRNVWVSVEEMLVLAQVRCGNAASVAALMKKHKVALQQWSKKVKTLRRLGAQVANNR